MFVLSKQFWADAAERAIKSAAQAVILALGAAEGFDLFAFDWQAGLGFGLGGAFLSLLTSLASGGIGPDDTPSLR